MWALLREFQVGARFEQRLTDRRRRRAVDRWSAASDDELRNEYAQLCRVDDRLSCAIDALRDVRGHLKDVPYSGPWRDRVWRVERRLERERDSRNANALEIEAGLYRRFGLAGGQSFGEWSRHARAEALASRDGDR